LLTAYDGTDFHGWQMQPGVRTVQGVIEEAVRRVVRHPTTLCGCGRTDAGVHAAAYACSFDTGHKLPVERFPHAVGARLPQDLSIIAARVVHPTFHARDSALSKLYRYRIHNASGRPVEGLSQRYAYHCWHPLDLDAMRAAAALFVGTRDFSAMASTGCTRTTMVRTVIRCDVERHNREIRIDVEGDGFLYHQVRNMTGTLIEVGRGRWPPEHVTEILESKDRTRAGPTAPAHGLCLRWVRYPPHLLRPPKEPALMMNEQSRGGA
jgi:tRNA pseudouridine38-40 synthase